MCQKRKTGRNHKFYLSKNSQAQALSWRSILKNASRSRNTLAYHDGGDDDGARGRRNLTIDSTKKID